MLRKTVLKSVTLAAILAAVAATGATSAFAGNGSFSQKNAESGGAKLTVKRPFGHIRDQFWQQHVDWCQSRFRTYNIYDNTYRPYGGPREQCWSPYIAR
jgi:hypothetical protein